MPLRNNNLIAGIAAALLALTGCGETAGTPPDAAAASPLAAGLPKLGLMSSLPLYWPEGADMAALATGAVNLPWQRRVIETGYAIIPLDTLSLIPALSPEATEVDPLAGLERLAVIQPRGLSPADNVALDKWVRAGGRLLLILDPLLTGEYAAAIGDLRRPVDTALIPPAVARWGMAIRFDEAQESKLVERSLVGNRLPLLVAGEVFITDPSAADCEVLAGGAAARCRIGKGEVTLIADAAVFEHQQLAGDGEIVLREMLAESLR
jgi:hypothetical protein